LIPGLDVEFESFCFGDRHRPGREDLQRIRGVSVPAEWVPDPVADRRAADGDVAEPKANVAHGLVGAGEGNGK
jgi:hypothetical protein